jgi:hypothetical protein
MTIHPREWIREMENDPLKMENGKWRITVAPVPLSIIYYLFS